MLCVAVLSGSVWWDDLFLFFVFWCSELYVARCCDVVLYGCFVRCVVWCGVFWLDLVQIIVVVCYVLCGGV